MSDLITSAACRGCDLKTSGPQNFNGPRFWMQCVGGELEGSHRELITSGSIEHVVGDQASGLRVESTPCGEQFGVSEEGAYIKTPKGARVAQVEKSLRQRTPVRTEMSDWVEP